MWHESVAADAPPVRLLVHVATGRLELAWADGLVCEIGALALRRACRCAECESRRRAGRAVAPDAPPDLSFTAANGMAGTGVQLGFTDGHARGIYPWHWLRELAREAAAAPPSSSRSPA